MDWEDDGMSPAPSAPPLDETVWKREYENFMTRVGLSANNGPRNLKRSRLQRDDRQPEGVQSERKRLQVVAAAAVEAAGARINSSSNDEEQANAWPPDRPAAVVVPPHVDREALHQWMHIYWEQDNDAGAAATTGTDLPFELVLPYETHRSLTETLQVGPVPIIEARQKAKLVCYPEAPSFLLLPHWPALDRQYARYNARTTLHRLLHDLEQVKRQEEDDLVAEMQVPGAGRATRRQEAQRHREAQMALYYGV